MNRPVESLESLKEENARLRAQVDHLRACAAGRSADEHEQLEALRQSELKYRRLHESLQDAFVFVDMTGRIREFNEAYRRMLGYESGELLALSYQELTPARWHAFEADIIELEVLRRGYSDVYEKEYRRKDGRVFPIELRTVLWRDATGAPSGMWAIVRDITAAKVGELALKESERQLRSLSSRLMSAQEAERSRLARELHDDFSQRVALLAVHLHLLKQSPPATPDALRAAVDGLYGDVQALGSDLRRMSHELHPARLEQLGLVSALEQLCGDVSAAHGIQVTCEARDVPREVPETLALCYYRVSQEALQNVVKHSGALAARVELSGGGGELHLVVADSGRGFDPGAARRTGSIGLVTMRERVRLVEGRFEVHSAPGRGTRIEVSAQTGAMAAEVGK